jgi:hypothetical protein
MREKKKSLRWLALEHKFGPRAGTPANRTVIKTPVDRRDWDTGRGQFLARLLQRRISRYPPRVKIGRDAKVKAIEVAGMNEPDGAGFRVEMKFDDAVLFDGR